MQVKTLLLAVILLTMASIQPGQACGAAKEIPDAQALIDACWAIFRERPGQRQHAENEER